MNADTNINLLIVQLGGFIGAVGLAGFALVVITLIGPPWGVK